MNEDQYQTLLTEFCNQYHIWDHRSVMDGIANLVYDETLTDTQKVEMVKRIVIHCDLTRTARFRLMLD